MKTTSFSLAVKWPGQTVWHLPRAKFNNQRSYTSTTRLLLGTYLYNFILPSPPTWVHTSQKVKSFLVL
jgi:hypothetical protein